MWLFERIISSFSSGVSGTGLPLGNLTSQLFANVYMNEFDQFVKHRLRAKHYIRYADDFVLLSEKRDWLIACLEHIDMFLREALRLQLHPKKIGLRTLSSGVDFLGWNHFEQHRILRAVTRQRMFRRCSERPTEPVYTSYFGLLAHGNANNIEDTLANQYWLLSEKM
jgi:hypothetical protein